MYLEIYSPFNSPAINGGENITFLPPPKLYEDLIGIQRMINAKIW